MGYLVSNPSPTVAFFSDISVEFETATGRFREPSRCDSSGQPLICSLLRVLGRVSLAISSSGGNGSEAGKSMVIYNERRSYDLCAGRRNIHMVSGIQGLDPIFCVFACLLAGANKHDELIVLSLSRKFRQGAETLYLPRFH